ncbi:hypothetical protein [Desulfurococcus amylolyticus]|nr:hypothetical protein [Desulfurococcus amylolyticus]
MFSLFYLASSFTAGKHLYLQGIPGEAEEAPWEKAEAILIEENE